MKQIIEQDIYKIPATHKVSILCSNCQIAYERKVSSIRSNIKNNGKFICHKCVVSASEYIEKQKSAHPKTGRKWDKKVAVNCSECGVKYEVNYRSQKWAERTKSKHHCKACSNKIAHKKGKYSKIYTKEFIDTLKKTERNFGMG